MNLLEDILKRKKDYNDFLQSVNLEELEKFSYAELKAFLNEFSAIKSSNIFSEISKLTQKKKEEEYPALLDVRYFPELKEIDFLTNEQLVELDKQLAKRPTNGKLFKMTPNIPYRLHKEIYAFLMDKEIINQATHLLCTCGEGTWLTTSFDKKLEQQWVEDLYESNKRCEYVGLLKDERYQMQSYCPDCDEDYSLGELRESFFENIRFDWFYCRIKEPNRELDKI